MGGDEAKIRKKEAKAAVKMAKAAARGWEDQGESSLPRAAALPEGVGVAMLKGLANVPASVSLFISFVLIFFIVFIVVRIIGAILSQIIRLTLLGWLDRLGGLVFGFMKGLLVASLILLGITLISWPRGFDEYIRRSTVAPSVQLAAPRFFNHMKVFLPTAKTMYKEFQESVDLYNDFDPRAVKEKAVQEVLQVFRKAE